MIPFFLVTGFLGSGKTTLLKHLLKSYGSKKRIAIIQNEFAPTGVDGKELQMTGADFKLIEINNGSVFCVCLLSNFIATLQKVMEDYEPEMIFLEASGLADPINITELLQDEKLNEKLRLEHIFCIVDGPNFQKGMSLLTRYRHQIMVADTVIVNKMDLLEEQSLGAIRGRIEEVNPFAGIVSTTFSQIDFEKELSRLHPPERASEKFRKAESGDRPDINACVLRTHTKISMEGLLGFIEKMKVDCPRIKGFLNLDDGRVVAIHTVFEKVEVKELSGYYGPSELIAFGQGLDVRDLRKRFQENA